MIHGGIATNNNRASTVLTAFLGAVQQFGVPTCVRSDKGGENVDVARVMLEHPQRGSGILRLFGRRKVCLGQNPALFFIHNKIWPKVR